MAQILFNSWCRIMAPGVYMKVTQEMIEDKIVAAMLSFKKPTKVLLDNKSYREFHDSFIPHEGSIDAKNEVVAKFHSSTKDTVVDILEVNTQEYLFEVT